MIGPGALFARSGGNGLGERIVLPLAADGWRADGVLGATVYRLGLMPTVHDGAAIDRRNEIVTYYGATL
jgi:hypothetical protein